MTSDPSLFLHEEILLLALKDKEGTPEFGVWYAQALAGAILAELLLHERITIDDSKHMLVHLADDQAVGDAIIDESLALIAEKHRQNRKPSPASHWITHFAAIRDLKNRVAESLCERRILRMETDKVLFLFNRTIFPEVDPRPERRLVERMREAVLGPSREIDARTQILLAIAHRSAILPLFLDKATLKAQKERIEKIAAGEFAASAAGQAIEASQAAQAAMAATLFFTTMVPVMMSMHN